MKISRPVIYYLLLGAIVLISASILSYNFGRSSTIGEVVTTTSVSTVPTTKTITTSTATTTTQLSTTTITSTTSIFNSTATSTSTTTATSTITATTTATSTTTKTNTVSSTVTITTTTTTTSTVTTTTTTTTTTAAFRFVVTGDSRGNEPNAPVNTAVFSKIVDASNRVNPAFTLFTGDLCYDFFVGDCPNVWKNIVNRNPSSKMVPIRGNHDGGSDVDSWQSTFDIASMVAGFGGNDYNYRVGPNAIDFSFSYRNSHFVGLDVLDNVGSSRPSAEQLSWLHADLTEAERTGCGGKGCLFTFILIHAPIYCVSTSSNHCSPPPTPPSEWTTTTNAHPSIAAVFTGHEHLLAYAHINGDRISGVNSDREYEEFIIGGGGAPLYKCGSRADWCDSNYGFAVVDVTDSTITVQIYNMEGTPLSSKRVFK